MAHSFDSTLIQRMGFKDPDRGTPNHDRACIEIATTPHPLTEALGFHASSHRRHAVDLEVPLQKGDGKYASTVGFIDAMITVELADVELEHWWQVGDSHNYGKDFRHRKEDECPTWTTIVERDPYSMSGDGTRVRGECHCSRTTYSGPNTRWWSPVSLLIEVKSTIDNVGDLLRQMNLYREYKQEHQARDGRRSRTSTFAVWSLRRSDATLMPLLASQGYKLVVGESLGVIEAGV